MPVPGVVIDDDLEAQVGRVAIFTLSCKYTFHKECITAWVKRRERLQQLHDCPLCRTVIDDALRRVLHPNYISRSRPETLGRLRRLQVAPQQQRMDASPPRFIETVCEESAKVLQERTKSAFLGRALEPCQVWPEQQFWVVAVQRLPRKFSLWVL
ncbi:MAG: hypothetical protein ACI9YB_000428 [Halioglobus sp.]